MFNFIIAYLAIGLCMSLIRIASELADRNDIEMEERNRKKIFVILGCTMIFFHMTFLWLPHFIATIFYVLERVITNIGGGK